MNFFKMHGLGNDFIIIDYIGNNQLPNKKILSKYAQSLCQRGVGIGGDGLVLLSGDLQTPVMTIFNPDGSEAEMCGNALRCVAKFLYEMKTLQRETLDIYTKAGFKTVFLSVVDNKVDKVCVNMGEPILDSKLIPVSGLSRKMISEPISTPFGQLTLTAVSMGVPHVVLFTKAEHKTLLAQIGPFLEKHSLFPMGTNVNLVSVHNTDNISVSVWERGVGETLACGTGACAATVASIINNYTSNQLTVSLPGGDLYIQWNRSTDNCIYMTGEAKFVYNGNLLSNF